MEKKKPLHFVFQMVSPNWKASNLRKAQGLRLEFGCPCWSQAREGRIHSHRPRGVPLALSIK